MAKAHDIRVKGKTEESLFSSTTLAPTKRQYITALSKELTEDKIKEELASIPKPEPKKKRRKKSSSFSLF